MKKRINMVRRVKVRWRYFCPKCQQIFTDTFDTLYCRRQVSAENVRIVLQSHAIGV